MEDWKTDLHRVGVDGPKLKASAPALYEALLERLTDEDDPDGIREAELEAWLAEHSPADALAEWFGWTFGDPSWARTILGHLLSLADSKMQEG